MYILYIFKNSCQCNSELEKQGHHSNLNCSYVKNNRTCISSYSPLFRIDRYRRGRAVHACKKCKIRKMRKIREQCKIWIAFDLVRSLVCYYSLVSVGSYCCYAGMFFFEGPCMLVLPCDEYYIIRKENQKLHKHSFLQREKRLIKYCTSSKFLSILERPVSLLVVTSLYFYIYFFIFIYIYFI